ncbi:MAG: histidinol dehydrogenase [Pseudomonadota bacterium]|nr:histidinol dehydrogenase [Pseudomonadota bacterium]
MVTTVSLYEYDRLDADERAALLVRSEADLSDYMTRVKPIIAAVRAEGDEALARFAGEFDNATVEVGNLKATEADFEAATARLEPDVTAAIEYAVDNIRRFHEAQKPEDQWMNEIRPGAFAGDRFRPIPSVACYVPRGKGSFPSVVMMTAVPAVVAGVGRIVIVTPPGPNGRIDDATLVAARLAGVSEVYKCGGAQAIAAVAYGTATVPRCHKVVGPGSPYVGAAVRLLADVIERGTPAGPSESIILADSTANPRIAALDTIIESEHGPDSSTYLVTDSRALADAAGAAIPEYWNQMGERWAGHSQAVLGGVQGGIVVTPDMDTAIGFVNDYAPEHLQILGADPHAYLERIENAGEILLGDHTPGTLGNFVLGPNAVLPTSGAAMTHSALSVFDFMKRSSVAYVTAAGYPEMARHARVLATYEGFDGHANAVSPLRDEALDD